MSVRLPPSVLPNEAHLREALDEAPDVPINGTARTLNRASLEDWGRSGDTWTRSRDAGGFYLVRGYAVDAEGWFVSWTGRVQTSAVVESEAELTTGKPVAELEAARVAVPQKPMAQPRTGPVVPTWFVIAAALAAAWSIAK